MTHRRLGRVLVFSAAGCLLLGLLNTPRSTGEARQGRPTVVLDGNKAQLTIDLAGGSIVNFHLKSQGLNPLVWGDNDDEPNPRAMGHFLCLDRWGPPSDAEMKNGMPFHGEAANVLWKQENPVLDQKGFHQVVMSAQLPLAGLHIQRTVNLSTSASYFKVTEEVTNTNKLGRNFNMVQHPTIGPPFLDENVLVDSNAQQGFMQTESLPNPEKTVVHWPGAVNKGKPVDMRRLTNDPNPNVVSYVLDDKYGWVTACNPAKGLLIAYLWKTSDYPWFNAWRHVENGKPLARGLEFGTTGLHQPFPTLVSKGKIFDRPLYDYLDAGQTVSKRYVCFLITIPSDYKGVGSLVYDGKQVKLTEHGSKRLLHLEVGPGLAR